MSIETKVISARVPKDVYDMLQVGLKKENINMSEFLRRQTVDINTSGGKLPLLAENKVPDVLKVILGGAGGLAVGTTVYNTLKTYLPDNRFDQEQIEVLSMIGGVVSGLATVWGVTEILKNLDEK